MERNSVFHAGDVFQNGKQYKAYRIEYTEASSTEAHSHDYMQIWYVVKGKCHEYIAETDHEIIAGETYIIPPYVEHHSVKEAGTVLLCCEFNIGPFLPHCRCSVFNRLSEFVDEPEEMSVVQRLMEYSAESKVIFPLSAAATRSVERTMLNLVEEYDNADRYSEQFMYIYIQELLLLLAREYEKSDEPEESEALFAKHKESILAAMKYIDENYAENLHLDDLCRVSLVSKTYFCYLFKLMTKQTYSEYLQNVRLQHAIEKLEQTDDSITQICFDVGFNDSTHFSRTFKKTVGVSARAYRAMKQGKKDA